LPSGDLRDAPSSYTRAEIIVVTKCPEELTDDERRAVVAEIGPLAHQQVFFSSIHYGVPYGIVGGGGAVIDEGVEVLLVTGIANPAPLKEWLDRHSKTYYEIAYGDHHIFSIDDLQAIFRRFEGITAEKKLILTTEKDAVRLVKFRQDLAGWPFFVLPIAPEFLFGDEPRFTELIITFINEFNSNEK